MGFGDKWANIEDGKRCSTATAYVHPYTSRSNFTVLTNAHVTKVCITIVFSIIIISITIYN